MSRDLSSYRGVDCKLYRTPVVNFSSVQQSLDKALVEMWKNGYSANDAINGIIADKNLAGVLSLELEESLKFQREQMLYGLEYDINASIDEKKTAFEAQKSSIKTSFIERKKDEKSKLTLAKKIEEERARDYSASFSELDEARTNIQKKLDAIGGKEGFNRLMGIYETVQSVSNGSILNQDKEMLKKPVVLKPEQKNTLEDALKLVSSNEEVSVQKDSLSLEPSSKAQLRKNTSWYKSVWEFLNTDIGDLLK